MNTDKKIIIALDGFSSSGKSTMAKALARRIGYRYVDTGAMYRAVTLWAMEHSLVDTGGNVNAEALAEALPSIEIGFTIMPDGTQHTTLGGTDVERRIRSMEVSSNVSAVAAIPAVRHALVAMQQAFGKEKGIVMDGRDIGTTVFPNAELKIFVCASAEERARRRLKEMTEKGEKVSFDEVYKNVVERDHIDTTRAVSPLKKASDAIELDNGNMTRDEQMEWLLDKFNSKVASLNKK